MSAYDRYGDPDDRVRVLYGAIVLDVLEKIGAKSAAGLRELAGVQDETISGLARDSLQRLVDRGLIESTGFPLLALPQRVGRRWAVWIGPRLPGYVAAAMLGKKRGTAMADKIVVGYDGSEHAKRALQTAITWVRGLPDAEIIIMCSQERPEPGHRLQRFGHGRRGDV